MDYIPMYILFFAKVFTLVVAFLLCLLATIAILGNKNSKSRQKGKIDVLKLNDKYKEMTQAIEAHTLDKKTFKNKLKSEKKSNKLSASVTRKKIYLIDFKGDIKASAVDKLSHEITAILQVATSQDEIVLRLESAGGVVQGYGLAASQLARIRDRYIPLTICIDKVAASGGYLMAVTGTKILAAPFAIIGSIGVIAQLPNFNKFLKKHDIDIEEHTAGVHKRTMSVLGEITNQDRDKFKENLEEIHTIFKNFVSHFRTNLTLEQVTTGDYWLAKRAIELKLIDELSTSDNYLMEQSKNADIFEIKFDNKKTFSEKLTTGTASLVTRLEALIF